MIGDAIHARDIAHVIGHAHTLDEVSALLSDAALDLGFAHVSIRAGGDRRDEGVLAAAADLWHIEYPIPMPPGVAYAHVGHEPMMLTIWCRTDGTDRPAGAERIARILAPAIGAWVANMPAIWPEDAEHPLVRLPVHSPIVPTAAIRQARRYIHQ